MKREKTETMEGMELPNQERIRMLGEKEKLYLGILEADTVKQTYKKEKKIRKQYLRRTKKKKNFSKPRSAIEISSKE